MYTTLSGQLAAFKHLEVIANNLANMTTTGFKSERVLFEKALTEEHAKISGGAFKSDIQKTGNLDVNDYVAIRGSFTDFTQGPIEMSGNPLDVAIQGKGFFVVSTPNGERYTRAGNFQLDQNNRLVTSGGHPVQGSSGDIIINGSDVSISNTGDITVNGQSVGKLRIIDVDGKTLRREAQQLFYTEGGNAEEVANPSVQSKALEASNVNAVRDLTDMIMASRVFDSFQKAQEANSRMSELRNSRVGSTQG